MMEPCQEFVARCLKKMPVSRFNCTEFQLWIHIPSRRLSNAYPDSLQNKLTTQGTQALGNYEMLLSVHMASKLYGRTKTIFTYWFLFLPYPGINLIFNCSVPFHLKSIKYLQPRQTGDHDLTITEFYCPRAKRSPLGVEWAWPATLYLFTEHASILVTPFVFSGHNTIPRLDDRCKDTRGSEGGKDGGREGLKRSWSDS